MNGPGRDSGNYLKDSQNIKRKQKTSPSLINYCDANGKQTEPLESTLGCHDCMGEFLQPTVSVNCFSTNIKDRELHNLFKRASTFQILKPNRRHEKESCRSDTTL